MTETWIIGPHYRHNSGPITLCPHPRAMRQAMRQAKAFKVLVAPCPVAGEPGDVPNVGDVIDIRERYPIGAYGPVLFRMRVEAREDRERPTAKHDGAELTLRRTR
jgi:hypothetical protein